MPWRSERLPTLAVLPGELHGQKSLVGYSPRGRQEPDTTGRFTSGSLHDKWIQVTLRLSEFTECSMSEPRVNPNVHSGLWLTMMSVQFSSVAQSCSTLCDPTDCSTPGLPVHHQLPESTQTYVHWVGDAIQPSHPLSTPSSCPKSFPASGS